MYMDIHDAMKLLNINTYSFSKLELKKAYFKYAIKCHPDKNSNSTNSTVEFQKLKEAYDVLLEFAITHEEDHISTSYEDTDIFNTIPSAEIDTIIQLVTCILKNDVIQFYNIGKLVDILLKIYINRM